MWAYKRTETLFVSLTQTHCFRILYHYVTPFPLPAKGDTDELFFPDDDVILKIWSDVIISNTSNYILIGHSKKKNADKIIFMCVHVNRQFKNYTCVLHIYCYLSVRINSAK